MAIELATAYVQIVPSFKGGPAGIAKQLSGVGDQAGTTAGKTYAAKFSESAKRGLKLGLAGAAAGIAIFGKEAVSAASDLNETINKTSVIFGKNAKVIENWSKDAATRLGLSQQAALEAASGFGDMFSQIGFGGKQATVMSKQVVQLATDLGSFNNLGTDEVIDMISGAFRGEYDSLQRVIPNISAARVQTEALAETHKKSASELTAAEKAQATLNIVMKDGARAQGDFAKTSGGLANQQKIMSAQWEDLQAKIGTLLLPVMVKLASFITTNVIPAIQSAAGWVKEHKEGFIQLGNTIAAIGSALYENIVRPILSAVIPAVKAVIGWISEHREGLGQLARFIVGGMKVAIGIIVGVFKFWAKQIQITASVVTWLWHTIIQPAAHGIKTAWETVSAAVRSVYKVVQTVFGQIGTAVHVFIGFIKLGTDVISDLWSGMTDGLQAAWGVIRKILDFIMARVDDVKSAISSINPFDHALGGSINAKEALRNSWRSEHPGEPLPPELRARGGPVRAGTPYIVGERRPELFIPEQNGRILPRVPAVGDRTVIQNFYYSAPHAAGADPAAIRRAAQTLAS